MDQGWIGGGRIRLSRRAVIGTWVAAVATAGTGAVVAALPEDRKSGAPDEPAIADQWTGSYLHIIAHPDDDLYFMNPPLQRSITQGAPTVTVVLTAAEADGRNVETDAQVDQSVEPDKPGYAEARHNGLRSAYALMATGDAHSAWRREVVKLTDGLLVELCTLAAKPTVQLYFFNLAQNLHGDEKVPDGTYVRLRMLWNGEVQLESTLPGTGAPVVQPQDFNRQQVVSCLVDLLKKHKPTVVRTMDPDSEHDPSQPAITHSDHIDHTATAQFALAALREYSSGDAQPVVEHYRGYSNKFWPPNISAQATEEKRNYLLPYAGLNIGSCPAHNCGDYQLGQDPAKTTHIISTAYRYTPTTDWLVRDGAGRLHAFAVLGGRIAHWAEQQPGGPAWRKPEYLPSSDWLLPRVKVLTDRDGRIHLIAVRRTPLNHGEALLEVVHTYQPQPDGPFQPWESLQGPDFGMDDQRARREIGVPAAAFDANGKLHVFVRDFSQGLSHRAQQASGGWGAWESLGAGPLQDAPTATVGKSGSVEVYVPDTTGVQRWIQQTGGTFQQTRVETGTPVAGAVTPVLSDAGQLTLYYRESRTAAVLALTLPAGAADPQPAVRLGGHDGTGEVAAIAGAPKAGDLVLHRNGWGGISTARRTASPQPPTWTDTGGPVVNAPALARDKDGRAVLAALGVDGRLHIAREQGTALSPWVLV